MSKVFSFPSSVGAKPEPWIEVDYARGTMREVPAPSAAELALGTRECWRLRDAHKDWKRQQPGWCEHCDESPCLQTEDCPGGRHYERRRAVERHQAGDPPLDTRCCKQSPNCFECPNRLGLTAARKPAP